VEEAHHIGLEEVVRIALVVGVEEVVRIVLVVGAEDVVRIVLEVHFLDMLGIGWIEGVDSDKESLLDGEVVLVVVPADSNSMLLLRLQRPFLMRAVV